MGSKNGGYIGIYDIERDYSIMHVDTFKVHPLCEEINNLSISSKRTYLLITAKIKEDKSELIADLEDEEPKDRLELY